MATLKDTNRPSNIRLTQAISAIRKCMKAEKSEKVRIVPLLLGPPGQGKTAIVEQLVSDLNAEREKKIKELIEAGHKVDRAEAIAGPEWELVSFRLGQCDPTDLKGVPVYTTVNGIEMCSFAPPAIFPILGVPESAHGKNKVIFLDELPQAVPTMQNLAANIIDGKVGDHTIDIDRSFIIAAGNRKEDNAATFDIPMNITGGRVITHHIQTSFDEWESWALDNDLHPIIVGFLKGQTGFFNEKIPDSRRAYGNPRAWHKLSCLVKHTPNWGGDIVDEITAEGTVGAALAAAFVQYYKAAKNQYSVNDIMNGKKVPYPTEKSKDILYSIVLEGAGRINTWMADAIAEVKLPIGTKEEVRAKAITEALGKTKVTAICNIYAWLHADPKAVSPEFQVLINKYQKREVKGDLRSCFELVKDFEPAAKAYKEISNRIMKRS